MEQVVHSSEQLVAVRFQAWCSEYWYGYAEVSDNEEYPPYRLCSSMALDSVLSPWSEFFLTWKALVPRGEALKALKRETVWSLRTSDSLRSKDVLVSIGPKCPDRENMEIAIIAVNGDDGYGGVEVVSAPGTQEAREFDPMDFIDYQIVAISKQPIKWKNVATFDSKGRFLSVRLRECDDGGIQTKEKVYVTRYSDEEAQNTEPTYYVRLNDWSGVVNTGAANDLEDKQDLAPGSHTLEILASIGRRILERV